MDNRSEAFTPVRKSPTGWLEKDRPYSVCRDVELLELAPSQDRATKTVDAPYVGRIGDAFVSGRQKYAAVRTADVDWTIDGADIYEWRMPVRPASLPPRMSHHAPIAFTSRKESEDVIGLRHTGLSGARLVQKPRDCMVYFPVGTPTFSGHVYLDRNSAAAGHFSFVHDIKGPAHKKLMKSWKETGSMVEASIEAGIYISATAAAVVSPRVV